MIRTLIEVTAETHWDHDRDLKATLDKLGYEPKNSADHIRFMDDLWRELSERGLEPLKLVEAQREKRDAMKVSPDLKVPQQPTVSE